ncbi:hypothetical protein V6N13_036909 [Hibiscus sabdariffa]
MSQNFYGISPFPGDRAGLSLNMENHEPNHWSYFRNLAQDDFVRKDVSLMDHDHLGFSSPLTNIEEYKKSPLKGDESAQVGENLQVPEYEFEDRKLDIRNTGVPLVDHSRGDFGISTLQSSWLMALLDTVLVSKDRQLDRRKRLIIAMYATFGMEYLHSKNIVHFDLKYDNLIVNLKDHVRPICKVGDFGLSKIKRNTLVTGGVKGNLPWMASELLNGSSSKDDKGDVSIETTGPAQADISASL